LLRLPPGFGDVDPAGRCTPAARALYHLRRIYSPAGTGQNRVEDHMGVECLHPSDAWAPLPEVCGTGITRSGIFLQNKELAHWQPVPWLEEEYRLAC